MKNIYYKLFFLLSVLLMTGCSTFAKHNVKKALNDGNLKDAELALKEIRDRGVRRHYGGQLIDEYLAIGNLDKAIYVFEKITGHCSMYQMQYSYSYEGATYTQCYSQIIYNALLKAGRYDEAWNYHERSYDDENYVGNAPNYFAYMTDCIIEMCNAGRASEVQKFIKQKGLWFIKNVDNTSYRDDYPEYCYDVMCSQLNKVYKEAQ